MDVALIQNPEHHVDHEDRDHEQREQSALRLREGLRVARQNAGDIGRQRRARFALHRIDRRTERDVRTQVERDRDGGQLAVMLNRLRSDALGELRNRAEWNQIARLRAHEHLAECRRIALILRLQLHDHPVLIGLRVDRRDLTRAVRVVQRLLDLCRRHAEGRRAFAIDLDANLRVADLQIAGDAFDLRQITHALLERTTGRIQLRDIRTLQRNLIRAVAATSADVDRRRIAEEDLHTRHFRCRARELAHDFIDVRTRAARRERHLQPPLIGTAETAAQRRKHERDIGAVGSDNFRDGTDLRAHRLIADAFGPFDRAGKPTGVFRRNEALRNDHEQTDRGAHHERAEQDRHPAMPHDPVQRIHVAAFARLIQSLDGAPLPFGARMTLALTQKARAEHRRQRKGDEARYEDRHTDRDRELPKEPADESRHEEQRDEHCDEGQRHR